ncbi:MAG: racemase [Gemmatimonadetes bacterium]|jgi:L-alanine-DL-glutamate epimerase-like enolase superfamily enzyme|nr:racemase [Gemmatimonadota bacterium]
MQITDIKCYVLEHIAPEPNFRWRAGLPGAGDGTPPGEPTYSSIIKVETDEGIVGMSDGRGYATADLVRRRLKKYIGLDPLNTEKLWHEIWELDRLEEFQVHQLGMLDVACWDIKSRKANMPLYKMLGGYDAKIPAYASTVTWDTMDEYERHIKESRDIGFTSFKLHAWGDAKEDAKLSRNLRKWVGDDADLMFDGSAGWDYTTSLWFGRVLEEVNFLWYEEPMREFDLVSYAELCRSLDIPVLAAETCDGCHWNAATWIQYRALDMMRVSVGFKGGVTGAIKVAHLAESFGMRAQVHGGGIPNLHLCAAIPNNDYYEQLVIDTEQIAGLEASGPLSIVDGYITAPDEPGLQSHPDWNEIEKRAVLIV